MSHKEVQVFDDVLLDFQNIFLKCLFFNYTKQSSFQKTTKKSKKLVTKLTLLKIIKTSKIMYQNPLNCTKVSESNKKHSESTRRYVTSTAVLDPETTNGYQESPSRVRYASESA